MNITLMYGPDVGTKWCGGHQELDWTHSEEKYQHRSETCQIFRDDNKIRPHRRQRSH